VNKKPSPALLRIAEETLKKAAAQAQVEYAEAQEKLAELKSYADLEKEQEMNKYLTPEQLCERWGNMIKLKTLSNWRHTREGPEHTKIGGKVAYEIVKVEEYENKRSMRQFCRK